MSDDRKLLHAEDVEGHSHSRWLYARIALLCLAVICLFGVVMHRMYTLQVEDSDLEDKAQAQIKGKMTLGAGGENHLDGHRGYIYDRDGFELAISVEVPSLYAHPKQIEDKAATAQALASILPMSEDQILAKLDKEASFVWVARKIKPSHGDAIRELNLPGVGLKRESKRYYPAQDVAGQILGFSGTDNVGLAGLEAAFDDELRGGVIEIDGIRDARGQLLLTLDSPRLNHLEGSSVVLTIDQYIQRVTEVAIERAVRKFEAKAGMAVVLDPHTGEILALANYPTFNPNRFSDYTLDDMRNRAVLDVYEPGSVVKPLLYAAGLDAGVINPETPLDGHGGELVFAEDVSISDTHTVKDLNAEKMVIESSNIGAYEVAMKLGRERFYNYMKAFGYGSKTDIGIAGESAGLLWTWENWYDIDFANLAFGQGLSVSALQMAMSVAILANGGKLMKPMLVKEVRDQNGDIVQSWTPEVRAENVLSDSAAEKTLIAMEKVVTEGTGLRAWVDGYRVGGKTGTPQKVDPRRKKYVNKWMANFVGVAPIDRPDLVVVVMIDEPVVSHLGGKVAAPVFAEIVSQVLPYRGVYPSEVYTGDALAFPTMTETEYAQIEAAAPIPDWSMEGNAHPRASTQDDEPTDLRWEQSQVAEQVMVPDFKGMTLRDAMDTAAHASLLAEPDNTGFVVDQWPAPGTQVDASSPVELTLARRYRQQHLGFIR